MNSTVAARPDRCAGNVEMETAEAPVDEVEREYGGKPYRTARFASEELYWMGYIYRCRALERGMSSREFFRLVNASELRRLYFPYHTMDAE